MYASIVPSYAIIVPDDTRPPSPLQLPSPPPVTPDDPLPPSPPGLRCATNRTLSIYVLDSVRHAPLAGRLGLTGGTAGAVILDSEVSGAGSQVRSLI